MSTLGDHPMVCSSRRAFPGEKCAPQPRAIDKLRSTDAGVHCDSASNGLQCAISESGGVLGLVDELGASVLRRALIGGGVPACASCCRVIVSGFRVMHEFWGVCSVDSGSLFFAGVVAMPRLAVSCPGQNLADS